MKSYLGALRAALFFGLLATSAAAQEPDAYVLPPGVARLSGGGEYGRFNDLFGASGKVPLGGNLSGPLVPATFAPLRPLESTLSTFLAATAGSAGATAFSLDPKTLTLGTADVALHQSATRAPIRAEIGIWPRLQVGVTFPFVRGEQLVERLGLAGAAVGANPQAARNAQLLARVGANGAALGALPLLPTSGSPAGLELQRRVRAANGGDSLMLPKTMRADSAAVLLQQLLVSEFGVDSLRSAYGRWRPGDVELDARYTLMDGLAGAPVPAAGRTGRAIRAALTAGVRLPTGQKPDTVRLFPREVQEGLTGFHLGAVGDLFLGQRGWISVGLRQVVLTPVRSTRRVAAFDAPLATLSRPQLVDWNPADTLELRVTPRYRIAGLISVGLDYRAGWVTESRYSGAATDATPAEVLNTPGGLTQRVGLGIRFLSLPAFVVGDTGIPMDVSLGYSRTLVGPERSPASSGVQLDGRIYTRVWGRGLRGR